MPEEQNIHKLETPNSLYINRFWTGEYTNRSPLFTPISSLGIQIIQRQDVLIDGQNLMVTPQFTMKRRYGFSKACSQAFGSNEFPLTFFSFQNLSGSIEQIVDTQTNTYTFTSSALTSFVTKSGGAGQTSFEDVANTLYLVNGVDLKKWDGSTLSNFGIATPAAALTFTTAGSGSLSPFVGYQWVFVYRNSSTGHISSASPFSANSGPQTSVNFNLAGAGSTDPQVDKIQIYRTKDGGGTYYFVAEIANIASWTYTDSTLDSALNVELIAPLSGINDPPPAGATLLTWYAGRLWCAVGNEIFFSAGPDCTNGVGEEAWPAANNFTVPGNVTDFAPTSQGLIVFTRDDAYVITGTSSSTFADPILWQANWGVRNQNCVAQDGDSLYVFTSLKQAFSYSSGTFSEIGFSIGDYLRTLTPVDCYVSFHRDGEDEGVFISDGSANLRRYSTVSNSWDNKYAIQGGCGAIMSMELSDDEWHLLLGRGTGSGYILQRDLTTFADDGTAYPAFGTFGSLTVAPPRQVMEMRSVQIQTAAVGAYPVVSVMLNEIKDIGALPATFAVLPNPVADPPKLPQSRSIWTKRHDLKTAQFPLPQQVQHLQIKITFATENAANELYGFGVA